MSTSNPGRRTSDPATDVSATNSSVIETYHAARAPAQVSLDPAFDASPDAYGDPESSFQSAHDSVSNNFESSDFDPSSATEFSSTNPPLDPLLLGVQGYSPVYEGDGFSMLSQSFDTGVQMDFRGSGFDWLDFDLPSIDLDMNRDRAVDADMPASACVNPPPGDFIHTLPTIQSRSNVLPWPFEQGQEAKAPRFPLPRLHEVLPKPLAGTGTHTSGADDLVRLLSCQQLPPPHELVNGNMSSGVELLRQLIGVYFSGFQIIQPIVHAPTWTMTECPTVLLAAMACIGSALSGEPNAIELSDSISEFCASMITWLGVSDNSSYSDITYLAALCLHQIYSLGSGNRQLYQNADRTRGVLIGSLRGLGLLSSRLNLHQEAPEDNGPTANDPAILHNEWTSWASRERERRIAWASFEYDCSLCTLTNRRGAVDLSELPSRLPCADSLWEAPSAYAWAALKSRSPSRAQGATLSGVLGAAMSGKPLTEQVSMWGKRLCAQIIGRLLWDLKQLETLSTSEYFGLSSLFKGHQQSKAALLRGLDSLLVFVNEPCSTSDLVSYNISSLLCHYSHLYAADDIMDIILYIVRNVASKGPCCDKRLDVARQRLTSAMKSDSRRARRLLWHAGQIVAVANEYLVSAPCEIMRLFMAYIFIVAYVKYCPRCDETGSGVKIRLDIPNRHADHRKAVAEWIHRGGPTQIGCADDIYTDGSTADITKDAQSMFQRLRSWGLAEKFAKILQCFENNEI
ncbi:hypothetical protein TOPH_07272 [Tolypocladium ophioglossoides CBS 100239]|uniref:Xylanolytic transcriptional activator regulatory domain-containing protein n=1 Tax=Tolypocladium ophioglossoides (strain CBS 100239) TaxID=1163406 RepID=A0A0L0N1V5_TOLOC|nr:hypothetical protein TOPH_07272 [Tolypocladium ophioglossoides CBS 100239]